MSSSACPQKRRHTANQRAQSCRAVVKGRQASLYSLAQHPVTLYCAAGGMHSPASCRACWKACKPLWSAQAQGTRVVSERRRGSQFQGRAIIRAGQRTIFVRKSHTMSTRIATVSGCGSSASPNPYIISATDHAGSEIVESTSGHSAVHVPTERYASKGSGAQRHPRAGGWRIDSSLYFANLSKPKPHSPFVSKGRLTLLSTSRTKLRCPCGAPRPCNAAEGVLAPDGRPDIAAIIKLRLSLFAEQLLK